MSKDKSHKGGLPSRENLYAEASKHTKKAIDVVAQSLDSVNESVRLGAAKIILAKSIPDLKGVEISGKNGEPIQINIVGDYVSPGGWNVPSPNGSFKRPDEIQSDSLAQTSEKNDHSA